MKKPTVIIIKASPWRLSSLFSQHPEYAAIFSIIKRYKTKINFVLVGSSDTPTSCFYLEDSIVACDVKKTKLSGHITYFFDLLRILVKYNADLAIVLGLGAVRPVAIYSFFTTKKYVPIFIGEFNYHGQNIINKILTHFLIKFLGFSIQISSKRISKAYALSGSVRDAIEKIASNLKGKISIISYPISSVFSSLENNSDLNVQQEPIILTIAGIEPRKGLDTLIEAASMIEGKFKIIIKGKVRDTVYMRKLQSMVKKHNLQEKISFRTELEDYSALVSLYRSAYTFVFPTRDDCLGVVVLESLHCGVPVIGTTVGGVPEMIENGLNGILVKPNDPVELAKAISFVLSSNEVRNKLAKQTTQGLLHYYANKVTFENALDQSITKMLTTTQKESKR